mmetsp:Transcript_21528/g.54083  ORF Transcript_21528/g.54083 Transcript_21528/m.54083 type:complete len:314 (+) Transcript_21528:654-1595(+)
MALENRSAACDMLGRRALHERHSACHIRGSVCVLSARIHQEEFIRAKLAVSLLSHSVVRDGSVGARRRDGVKRKHLELGVLRPEGLCLCAQVQLRDVFTPLNSSLEPAQSPGHRSPIPHMCFLHALHFLVVLSCFWDSDGGGLDDSSLPGSLLDSHTRSARIQPELDTVRSKLLDISVHLVIVVHRHAACLEVPIHLLARDLGSVDVEPHLLLGHDRKRHAHGRVVNIGSPDVEQPADLHQIASDIGRSARIIELLPEGGNLFCHADSRILHGMNVGGCRWGVRPPLPYLIQGVVSCGYRDELVIAQSLLKVV